MGLEGLTLELDFRLLGLDLGLSCLDVGLVRPNFGCDVRLPYVDFLVYLISEVLSDKLFWSLFLSYGGLLLLVVVIFVFVIFSFMLFVTIFSSYAGGGSCVHEPRAAACGSLLTLMRCWLRALSFVRAASPQFDPGASALFHGQTK